MTKEEYKFQFDFWTKTLGLSHKIPFNDIWKALPHNLNIKGLPYAKEYLKS